MMPPVPNKISALVLNVIDNGELRNADKVKKKIIREER